MLLDILSTVAIRHLIAPILIPSTGLVAGVVFGHWGGCVIERNTGGRVAMGCRGTKAAPEKQQVEYLAVLVGGGSS